LNALARDRRPETPTTALPHVNACQNSRSVLTVARTLIAARSKHIRGHLQSVGPQERFDLRWEGRPERVGLPAPKCVRIGEAEAVGKDVAPNRDLNTIDRAVLKHSLAHDEVYGVGAARTGN
jgi:hypothetical protein